jgi:hypothetical protein
MTDWESLNDRQKKVLYSALDLVNGGQDLEKILLLFNNSKVCNQLYLQ